MDGDGCLTRPHAKPGRVGSGPGPGSGLGCISGMSCCVVVAGRATGVDVGASALGPTAADSVDATVDGAGIVGPLICPLIGIWAFDSSRPSSSFSRCSSRRDVLMSCTWSWTMRHRFNSSANLSSSCLFRLSVLCLSSRSPSPSPSPSPTPPSPSSPDLASVALPNAPLSLP